MRYSAWDWDRLQYNYFVDRRPESLGGWKPLTGLGMHGTADGSGPGMDIEDALPVLPSDAIPAGTGVQAIGQIVVMSARRAELRGMAGTDDLLTHLKNNPDARKLLAGAAVGFGAGVFYHKAKTITTVFALLSALLLGLNAADKPATAPAKPQGQ